MNRPGNIQSFLTPKGKMTYSLSQYPRGQWLIQVQRPGIIQPTMIANQVRRGLGISDQAAAGSLSSYLRIGGSMPAGGRLGTRNEIRPMATGGSRKK